MKKPVLALAAGLVLWGLANTSQADSIVSVTETHYDSDLRPDCVAVRMNVSTFADAPSDACTPKASVSANGPDRINRTVYDAAGQVTQVIQAYGTSSQRVYSTFSYSANGKLIDTIDANGNRTHNVYDGFDRLVTLYYPSTTRPSAFNPSTQATALSTAGAYNSADYEQFTYDANSNRKTWRRRNGLQISYTYDALNREIKQSGDINDWTTNYDGLGHVLSKLYGTGLGVSYTYDALGQILSTSDWLGRTVKYQYNQASGRTKLTYPDGNWVGYTLDNLSRVTALGMNAYSGLSLQSYDDLGRVLAENRGYLAASARINFTYDGLGRLTKMIDNFAGTNSINDVTWTFSGRNPAGQITTWGASVTDYDYVETATATDNRTYDGLNRDASIAAVSGGYDANGNLANDGTRVMTYDFYNRLTKVADAATPTVALVTLRYDTEGRLASYTASGVTTEFLYDGTNLIAEYRHVNSTHASDTLLERYVHGTGVDEPLVWYHGSDLTDQRYFWRNYQGSLIAYGDDGGHMTELYKYGPYGEPRTSSNGDGWGGSHPRFAYTGQIMIPEAKLYYYKARVYDPAFGRFLQTDPVGSDDDLDLYAYVAGDPVNKTDPSGECGVFIAQCIGAATGAGIELAFQLADPKTREDYARAGSSLMHGDFKGAADAAGNHAWSVVAAAGAGALGAGVGGAVETQLAKTVLGKGVAAVAGSTIGGAVSGGTQAAATGGNVKNAVIAGGAAGGAGRVMGAMAKSDAAQKGVGYVASQGMQVFAPKNGGAVASGLGAAADTGVQTVGEGIKREYEKKHPN